MNYKIILAQSQIYYPTFLFGLSQINNPISFLADNQCTKSKSDNKFIRSSKYFSFWSILSGCGHQLCVRCSLYLCSTSNTSSESFGPSGSVPCPLCRHGIISFVKLPSTPRKDVKLALSLTLCTPCILHPCELDKSMPSGTHEIRKNRVASISSDHFCPVTCSPFPSSALPLCTCDDGPYPNFEPGEGPQEGSNGSQSTLVGPRSASGGPESASVGLDKMGGVRLGKATCSSMLWRRRSCSREQQCNSEINAWTPVGLAILFLYILGD